MLRAARAWFAENMIRCPRRCRGAYDTSGACRAGKGAEAEQHRAAGEQSPYRHEQGARSTRMVSGDAPKIFRVGRDKCQMPASESRRFARR